MSEIVEVDATLAFSQTLTLRAAAGASFQANLDIYECAHPYVLVFVVTTAEEHAVRMDIHKEDLASELRRWLDGPRSHITHPALVPSKRLDDHMMKFVKFGNPPAQEILFRWILTRTEIQWGLDPMMSFGGLPSSRNLHNVEVVDHSKKDNQKKKKNISNQYEENVRVAMERPKINEFHLDLRDDAYLEKSEEELLSKTKSMHTLSGNRHKDDDDDDDDPIVLKKTAGIDVSSFELTRKLLGRSQSLELLKQSRKSTSKIREGAKSVASIASMTSDQFKLSTDIEKTRKEIEEAMEIRRRTIEISKVRQEQIATKYSTIRNSFKQNKQSDSWHAIAFEELINLRKTKEEVERDVIKQKIKAKKAQQLLSWTMAPPGFNNYRGKSVPGYPIGEGPLPFTATSNLRNPQIERVTKKYYWDSYGRRHRREKNNQINASEQSLVDQAFEAIRIASQNIAAYKLDLKAVFQSFDTSGDGFLSKEEMSEAFLHLGVPLDLETANILFNHFDPNGSGSVHYGEFQWAFFNRRALARKYKRHVTGLTEQQITAKFNKFDMNGDGVLNSKEFNRLLMDFEIKLSGHELNLLMDRFDKDGDGCIDMYEFRDFIDEEVNKLHHHHDSHHDSHHSHQPQSNLTHLLGQSSTVSSISRSLPDRFKYDTEDKYGEKEEGNHDKNHRNSELEPKITKVLFMNQILQAQALIERKLGSRYYS